MDEKYNVVLKGCSTHASEAEVIKGLATLFKCQESLAKNLLAAPSHIVKRDIPLEIAEKYRQAVCATGANCSLEPVKKAVEQLDFDVTSPTKKSVSARPETVGGEILFRGDVSNITSLKNILDGEGLITHTRCTFDWGKGKSFNAARGEIASVEELKHGLATKLAITHRNGAQIFVQAPNMKGLTAAMYSLVGKSFDPKALAAPDVSGVKNFTAWLAAFGPLIAAILVFLWYGDRLFYFGFTSLARVWIFKLVLIYTFMRIDHVCLQRQGFDLEGLGVTRPEKFWVYLFNRAKAFKQRKGYAITWAAIFGLEIAPLILAIF